MIVHVRRRQCSWAGHSTEYKITDKHRISATGEPSKGKHLEKSRRDDEETNQTTTGRVPSGRRIAQDKQMWKQHAEAFTQSRDTTAAQ